MNAPGEKFLKVSGTLLIIVGAIYVVVTILITLVAGAVMQDTGTDVPAGALIAVGIIVAVIVSGLQFISGIICVKNCAKPLKYKRCMACGIIVIITSLYSVGSSLSEINMVIIMPVVLLALGIFAVCGALKNKAVTINE